MREGGMNRHSMSIDHVRGSKWTTTKVPTDLRCMWASLWPRGAVYIRGRFLVRMALSATRIAQLFPTFFRSWKRSLTFSLSSVDRKGKFSSQKVWRNGAQLRLCYKKLTPGQLSAYTYPLSFGTWLKNICLVKLLWYHWSKISDELDILFFSTARWEWAKTIKISGQYVFAKKRFYDLKRGKY
jgi:hypothetical protein